MGICFQFLNRSYPVVIFMEIGEKFFDSFIRTFLTNRGKNEDEDEKFGKMTSIFESKLGYKEFFIKILEKSFFKNFYLKRTYYDRGVKRVKLNSYCHISLRNFRKLCHKVGE